MLTSRASFLTTRPSSRRLTPAAALAGSLGALLLCSTPARASSGVQPAAPLSEGAQATSTEGTQSTEASSPDDAPGEPAVHPGPPTDVPPTSESAATSDTALAFDRVTVAELEELEALGRRRFESTSAPAEPFMRPDRVTDPFPNGHRRTRPHHIFVPLAVSAGLVAGGATMAHLALNPDCQTAGEIDSCAVPNGADIGVRSGRALAAVGFGLGGGVFGALGGRALGARLQYDSRRPFEHRRRIALGVGTSSVVLGAAGFIAGSVLLAQGIEGAKDVGADAAETDTLEEALPLGDQALDHVTRSRVGFMLLASTPSLVSFGASLLAHRPRRTVRVAPSLSRQFVGVSVQGRF